MRDILNQHGRRVHCGDSNEFSGRCSCTWIAQPATLKQERRVDHDESKEDNISSPPSPPPQTTCQLLKLLMKANDELWKAAGSESKQQCSKELTLLSCSHHFLLLLVKSYLRSFGVEFQIHPRRLWTRYSFTADGTLRRSNASGGETDAVGIACTSDEVHIRVCSCESGDGQSSDIALDRMRRELNFCC